MVKALIRFLKRFVGRVKQHLKQGSVLQPSCDGEDHHEDGAR